MSLQMSASQTIGPYLHIGTDWLNTPDLAGPEIQGERIVLQGRMLDGNGKPVDDGLVELWQANHHGKYADPQDDRDLPMQTGFRGFGRVPTDAQGYFRFSTIKPGRVPGPDGKLQAPHIAVTVFARGLLKHLVTRIYFPDDAANADDPVLALVPAARRTTLIARKSDQAGVLEWNIVLQSNVDETVFFDI
ncbi:MAG: protocatechuate 3,4-dioxygenase subunit alpha [Herbaspirillum sp.]